MSDELKACPFCAGPTRDSFPEGDRMVSCDNPYCESGGTEMYPESWNVRPIEAELLAALEVCKEVIGQIKPGVAPTITGLMPAYETAKALIAKHGEKP
jgi:hypothetical protein